MKANTACKTQIAMKLAHICASVQHLTHTELAKISLSEQTAQMQIQADITITISHIHTLSICTMCWSVQTKYNLY